MPYDSGALILRFLHSVAFTDEIAETQLSLSGGPGWDEMAAFGEWDSTDLGDALNAYATLMTGSGLYWGSYSSIAAVKLAAVSAAGVYLADPIIRTPDGVVSGAAAHVPPQDSVVLSLRTGHHVGYANYGRMYLPHTILPLASGTATASSTDTGTLAGHAKTFLDAINAIARGKSHPHEIVVRSSKGGGATKEVAEVWVGNVVDTQRRRRNRIPEAYSKQNLA